MFRRKSECDRIKDMLSEYLDERLSGASKAHVNAHIAHCASCSNEVLSLQVTVKALHAVPQVVAPRSFAVRDTVKERRPAPAYRGLRWLQPATAVICIVFLVLLAGDLFQVFPLGNDHISLLGGKSDSPQVGSQQENSTAFGPVVGPVTSPPDAGGPGIMGDEAPGRSASEGLMQSADGGSTIFRQIEIAFGALAVLLVGVVLFLRRRRARETI